MIKNPKIKEAVEDYYGEPVAITDPVLQALENGDSRKLNATQKRDYLLIKKNLPSYPQT